MACFFSFQDNLELCPYQDHMVAKRHFINHLLKCEKNPKSRKLERCPFDVKHRIDKALLDDHMKNCPSSITAIRDMASAEARAIINKNDPSWPDQETPKVDDIHEVSDPWSLEASSTHYTAAGLVSNGPSGALRSDGFINNLAFQGLKKADRRKLQDEMVQKIRTNLSERKETMATVSGAESSSAASTSSTNNQIPSQSEVRRPGIGRGKSVQKN